MNRYVKIKCKKLIEDGSTHNNYWYLYSYYYAKNQLNIYPKHCIIILIGLWSFHLQCQDSLQTYQYSPPIGASYTLPTALLLSGIFINQEDIRMDVHESIRSFFGPTTSRADDYLQHSPIVGLYAASYATGATKQQVWLRTKHLLYTQALNLGLGFSIKSITKEARPNGGTLSFPSGHTSYAFASATVIYHSFKDRNKLLAYSGYLPAAFVGISRIRKNKHWPSDVVFGAGLGILSAHLTYKLVYKKPVSNSGSSAANYQIGIYPGGAHVSLTF